MNIALYLKAIASRLWRRSEKNSGKDTRKNEVVKIWINSVYYVNFSRMNIALYLIHPALKINSMMDPV